MSSNLIVRHGSAPSHPSIYAITSSYFTYYPSSGIMIPLLQMINSKLGYSRSLTENFSLESNIFSPVFSFTSCSGLVTPSVKSS